MILQLEWLDQITMDTLALLYAVDKDHTKWLPVYRMPPCMRVKKLDFGGPLGATVFMMVVMKIDTNIDFQGVTCTAMIWNTKGSEKLKAVLVYLKSVAGSTEKQGRC